MFKSCNPMETLVFYPTYPSAPHTARTANSTIRTLITLAACHVDRRFCTTTGQWRQTVVRLTFTLIGSFLTDRGGPVLRVICALILGVTLTPKLSAQCNSSSCPTPVGSPSGFPENGYTWIWNTSTCEWQQVPGYGYPSPIVIDTDGTGFHLTSASNGVLFDFYGTGSPIQMAWTAKGSTNGWLALPVNGRITSARDLFGNISPQPLSDVHPPNGFAALAIYDTAANGGNHNGAIDPGDAIWSKLRVWIDANHDGISQPEELHTLDEFGIGMILLHYELSERVDQYGNQFRYEGHLVPMNGGDGVDRKIYDVFLVAK